ncbi:MAG: tRNA-specific adenosine deaminase [Bacteroidia bacterium]|nr:MAG: tRNA-specific adenosine deaminase [Bacteroidia bacterium]
MLACPQDDIRFMRLALQEAQAAFEAQEVPIGAVVVSRGRILARAHNLVEALHDPTAHAEMLAITAATNALGAKFLHNATLYVTIEPCPMCAAALHWAHLHRLVYGAKDPKRGYSIFQPGLLHPRTAVTAGIMAERCAGLMEEFFRARR